MDVETPDVIELIGGLSADAFERRGHLNPFEEEEAVGWELPSPESAHKSGEEGRYGSACNSYGKTPGGRAASAVPKKSI